MSLVYRLVMDLFGLLTVLVRSDLSKDVELLVLRHEVLRRRLGSRPRWDHTDRLWLAALSRLIHRRRWTEVFRVIPGHLTAIVGVVITLSACGLHPQWYNIASAAVSPDGKTVTVTAQVNSCQEVTSSTVSEQTTDVTVGIEVRDNCEPFFPWEEGSAHTAMGYDRKVQLRLEKPLADRRLIDRATQQEVPILW
ncbi:hypothetical protein [Nonomuraea sp. NPDC005650]|uniref:hypothetical protein n=1 Tax=Nonomuraea sp. NPDC005650 TaxID=3157045 RepID=UPI0033A4BB02